MFSQISKTIWKSLFLLQLSGCTFFESTFAQREKLLRTKSISLAVQFVDHSKENIYCSKMAVFEMQPNGNVRVQWFHDTGLVGIHGCAFDWSNPAKSEHFELTTNANAAIRNKLARLDWSISDHRRNNVCGMDTNEGAPILLEIGDSYPVLTYGIYPNWIDDEYLSEKCKSAVHQEVKILDHAISDLPIEYSSSLGLR